ncbi:MAG: ABC transporter ATP-binding protein [Hassallia sp. WJT32-NPBG1]|jgi:lipopolysaccharide transport system ATP-binding protein|nr:ABC transporter ATP-binding protein [Hassallia sp. WJT32-NPBG1]
MMKINEQEISEKPQDNDSEVVLSVNGVSKRFCRDLKKSLFYGVQDIGSEVLGLREKGDKLRPKEFWALDNVSFQLRRGEALGLVGKNGSGKSTLLRVIAGLIKPDMGFVEVNGRVAPLIALGAGFNPILTGRENIYANMSILGLSKKEIDERFDEVIEFAEIGDAIDSPVQSYSSGMAARLGFASAIHTEPDILLIDEVLAVGDMKFRTKCYRKLAQLTKKGVSFVLVSHDPNSILAVCNSATFLSMGKVIESGNTHKIMKTYEESLFPLQTEESTGKLFLSEKNKDESLGLDIAYICFKDHELNNFVTPISGNNINLCIGLKAHKQHENIQLNLLVSELSIDSGRVLRLNSFNDNQLFNMLPGEHEIQVQMPYCCLKPGLYSMKMSISHGSLYILDGIESFNFTVESPGNMSDCSFYQPRIWKLSSKSNFPE